MECWQPIVSANQRGMDFMPRHGIKGLVGEGGAPGGATGKVTHQWRNTLARTRRDAQLGEDLIVGYLLALAPSHEKAIELGQPFFEENLKMFGALHIVQGLTDEQIAALAEPEKALRTGIPTMQRGVDAGSYLWDTSDQVIEQLMEVQERLPRLEMVNLGHADNHAAGVGP